MFKLWIEKFVVRFLFVAVLLSVFVLILYALYTETKFDVSLDQAPFAETMVNSSDEFTLARKGSAALAQPHRGNKELQTWSSRVVSEALSFTGTTTQETVQQVEKYFTSSGSRQYRAYIEQVGIPRVLSSASNTVSVFVEERPLLLNSQEVGGVYRWLYQIPMTLSFIPNDSRNLRRGASNIQNRKINLRIQLRRTDSNQDDMEVLIESWAVTGRQ